MRGWEACFKSSFPPDTLHMVSNGASAPSPAVATPGMQPRVARVAQRHEVVPLVVSAFAHGPDMVYGVCDGHTAFGPAHLAERMIGEEGVPRPLPVVAIAPPLLLRPGVAVVVAHRQPCVLRTVPSVRELGTAEP